MKGCNKGCASKLRETVKEQAIYQIYKPTVKTSQYITVVDLNFYIYETPDLF